MVKSISSPEFSREIKRAAKYSLIKSMPIQLRLEAIPRILPKYKCIYIHVPKTGGTSIANVFSTLSGKTQASPRIRLHEHIKAHEIRQLIGKEKWSQYFSFAFVRNPWDLMVSSYHWWIQKSSHATFLSEANNIRSLGSFSGFIRSPYGKEKINECQGKLFDWISDEGEIIVSFVGKFESFQADFDKVCQHLDAPRIQLPHSNKTSRKNYRDYYTDETMAIVAKRFAKTIDMFDYHF